MINILITFVEKLESYKSHQMKISHLFMPLAPVIFSVFALKAQKYTEGDKTLSFLAGVKNIKMEYDYSNMMVGKKTEEEYKKGKIADYNAKQPGKGERWAEKWVNNRSAIYEPMFEELINKIMFKAKT